MEVTTLSSVAKPCAHTSSESKRRATNIWMEKRWCRNNFDLPQRHLSPAKEPTVKGPVGAESKRGLIGIGMEPNHFRLKTDSSPRLKRALPLACQRLLRISHVLGGVVLPACARDWGNRQPGCPPRHPCGILNGSEAPASMTVVVPVTHRLSSEAR